MESSACPVSRWQMLKNQLNNLDPAAFASLAATPGVVVLDVRTRTEYEASHLPGARHFDYFASEFLDALDTLDPQATYLVYCRSGRRSIRACTLMKNSGFANVYNLDGGLNAHEALA